MYKSHTGEVSFFAYGCSTPSIPFVEKAMFPPLNWFCTFVKNQFTFVWANFWVLCSISLLYTCLPLPNSHSLDYYSCIINPEIKWLILPTLFIYLKILITTLISLPFHKIFRRIWSTKKIVPKYWYKLC